MIATTFRQDKIIRETVNIYGDKQYMTAVEEMCVTCKWAEECNQHDCDRGCNWVWKGDEE